MTLFLLAVAALRAWHGRGWAGWVIAAVLLALAAALVPSLLRPLNRLWLRLGLMLHRLTSPLILGFLFFAVITPVGLLMRLFGKRPLQLRFDPQASSYWTQRQPPGPDPRSMTNQF